jgi:hypothetical protein
MSSRIVSVAEVGAIAARTLERQQRGRVVAAFERSAYVEIGASLVCIGVSRLGSGPLNALVASVDAAASFRALAGADVECDCAQLRIAHLALDFAAARVWRPAPIPAPVDFARVLEGIERVRITAHDRVPNEGLAFLVGGVASSNALVRVARPAADALRAWLTMKDRRVDDAPVLESLIGLGPGLTPSGDDFLGGALIALHAFGERDAAARLAASLQPLVRVRTHPISVAHFDAACEGFGNAALHACLHDVASARDPRRSLARVAAIGHTSGWDALAGALVVADALASAAAGRRSEMPVD